MQQNQQSSLFDLDEIVWARVTGYPYWPGQISCIYEKQNLNGEKYFDYVVNFYKDVSHAILKEKSLLKYVQNYSECSASKYKGLKNAIIQADSILANQKREQLVKKDNTRGNSSNINGSIQTQNLDDFLVDLQVILNCLTFEPNNMEYLWKKLTHIIQKLEEQSYKQNFQNNKAQKVFKCIVKLLKNREKQLKSGTFQVSNMIQRMEKIIQNLKIFQLEGAQEYSNHHFSQDTQSEEYRIKAQSNSIRKESLVPMYEETEQEHVVKNINFNDEQSVNQNSNKFKSAFTPVNKDKQIFDWERLNPLKFPQQTVQKKPILQLIKSFQPIIILPVQ